MHLDLNIIIILQYWRLILGPKEYTILLLCYSPSFVLNYCVCIYSYALFLQSTRTIMHYNQAHHDFLLLLKIMSTQR